MSLLRPLEAACIDHFQPLLNDTEVPARAQEVAEGWNREQALWLHDLLLDMLDDVADVWLAVQEGTFAYRNYRVERRAILKPVEEAIQASLRPR